MSSKTVPPFIVTQLVANPFIGPEGTPESSVDIVNQRLESSLIKINSILNLEIRFQRGVASSRGIENALSHSSIAVIGCHGYEEGALGVEYTPESSDNPEVLKKFGTTHEYKEKNSSSAVRELQVLVIDACYSESVCKLYEDVPHVVVIKR
jgi:hypothetical protein